MKVIKVGASEMTNMKNQDIDYLSRIRKLLQNNYDSSVEFVSINNEPIKKSNKFTLVIPTHDRFECLKRSIKFFKDLEAEIIYCDSSENSYNGEFAQNMRYIHLPRMKLESKLKKAFEEVNTEFITLCAVDDFAIHNTLYKGAEFLDMNREYSTVMGRFLAFLYHFDGKFIKMYRHVNITDFNDKDLKTRVERYFKYFFPTFYAMHRKNTLIEVMDICKKCDFKNLVFIEMVMTIIACARGNIKFLPHLWGVREYNPDGIKRKYMNQIYKDISIKEDFNTMKENVDKVVFNGYSDFILQCYLKFCASKGIEY